MKFRYDFGHWESTDGRYMIEPNDKGKFEIFYSAHNDGAYLRIGYGVDPIAPCLCEAKARCVQHRKAVRAAKAS